MFQLEPLIAGHQWVTGDVPIRISNHGVDDGDEVFAGPPPVSGVRAAGVDVDEERGLLRAIGRQLEPDQMIRIGSAGVDPERRGRQVAERTDASPGDDVHDAGHISRTDPGRWHGVADDLHDRLADRSMERGVRGIGSDRDVDRIHLHEGADDTLLVLARTVVHRQPDGETIGSGDAMQVDGQRGHQEGRPGKIVADHAVGAAQR